MPQLDVGVAYGALTALNYLPDYPRTHQPASFADYSYVVWVPNMKFANDSGMGFENFTSRAFIDHTTGKVFHVEIENVGTQFSQFQPVPEAMGHFLMAIDYETGQAIRVPRFVGTVQMPDGVSLEQEYPSSSTGSNESVSVPTNSPNSPPNTTTAVPNMTLDEEAMAQAKLLAEQQDAEAMAQAKLPAEQQETKNSFAALQRERNALLAQREEEAMAQAKMLAEQQALADAALKEEAVMRAKLLTAQQELANAQANAKKSQNAAAIAALEKEAALQAQLLAMQQALAEAEQARADHAQARLQVEVAMAQSTAAELAAAKKLFAEKEAALAVSEKNLKTAEAAVEKENAGGGCILL